MMAFMGVLISWLMLARNSLLKRLTSSAFILDRRRALPRESARVRLEKFNSKKTAPTVRSGIKGEI